MTLPLYLALLQGIIFTVTYSEACNTSVVAYDQATDLSSPNYPWYYGNNENCWWKIRTSSYDRLVGVKIVDFNLELNSICKYDNLSFYDEPCYTKRSHAELINHIPLAYDCQSVMIVLEMGPVRTHFQYKHRTMTIVELMRNSRSRFHVFEITYDQLSPKMALWNRDLDLCLDASRKQPECSWITIEETCFDSNIRYTPSDDTSAPLLSKRCGNTTEPLLSTGRDMYLKFRTDGSRTFKGFKLQFFQVKECGGELTATSVTQYVASPGYPYTYFNNLSCRWRIKAERGTDTILIGSSYVAIQDDLTSQCDKDALTFHNGNATNLQVVTLKDLNTLNITQAITTVLESPSKRHTGLLGRFCGRISTTVQSSKDVLSVDFLTDNSITDSGFNLSYTAKQERDCNFTMVANRFPTFIYSPGYPEAYNNNLDCYTKITSGARNIRLEITSLDIEGPYPQCENDFLTVYKGVYGIEKLASWCGDTLNGTVINSNSSLMYLRFTTDRNTAGKGYRLMVTAPVTTQCQHSTITAFTFPNYLQSPGYPTHYYNYAYCIWTITAFDIEKFVRIVVTDADFETNHGSCSYDYVEVHDGATIWSPLLRKWCSGQQTYMQSSGYRMTLRFVTDSSNFMYRGFKLKYFETSDNPTCGSTSLIATSFPQYLQSPGYPTRYYNNEDCTWQITASNWNMKVRIVVLVADMEDSGSCSYDYVTVYDGYSLRLGSFCSMPAGFFQSNSHRMTLKFHTDSSGNSYKGFRVKYYETSGSGLESSCGGTVNATRTAQSLTSPNYPLDYPSDVDCTWRVYAPVNTNIQLTMIDLHIESQTSCTYDYLVIYDGTGLEPSNHGRLCGSTVTGYTSSSNSMTIKFHSDGSTQRSGFDFQIQAGDYQVCTQTVQLPQASYSDQYLLSPNYPFRYPNNADCSWLIDTGRTNYAVHIEVLEMSIESSTGCSFDYVEAFDGDDDGASSLGKWCGTDVPLMSSTGRYMFIKFKSDSSNNRGKFKIEYTNVYHYHSPNIGAIVGGIVGGIVAMIFIIVIIVTALSSRRQKPPVTRVQDTRPPPAFLYTVSQGALESPLTPATFAPPPSYSVVTAGTGVPAAPSPPTTGTGVAAVYPRQLPGQTAGSGTPAAPPPYPGVPKEGSCAPAAPPPYLAAQIPALSPVAPPAPQNNEEFSQRF